MKYALVSIIAFLLLKSISPLPAQIYDLEDYDCRYDEILEMYQERDSIEKISELPVLSAMTDVAMLHDKELAESLCKRMLNISDDYADPIIAKALYYSYTFTRSISVWDSLLSTIKDQYGDDSDVYRLIQVGRISRQITPTNPLCTNVDSILNQVIDGFNDVSAFYFTITASLQMLSICASKSGDSDRAIQYEKERGTFINKYYSTCARQVGSWYISLGRRYQAAGKLDSAEFYFRKSKEFNQTYRPDAAADLLMSSVNIASCLNEQGYPLQMINELLEAEKSSITLHHKSAVKSLSPDVTSTLAIIYNLLGNAYQDLGSDHKAINYFQKSIAEIEVHESKPNIQKLVAYANIGENMAYLQEFEAAEKYLFKAREFADLLVGENHYFSAVILMNIGNLYFEKEEYGKCEEYYDKSLAIRKKLFGESHQSLGNIYINYAELFEARNEEDLVVSQYDKAIEIYKNTFGSQNPKLAQAYLKKASFLNGADKNVEAKKMIEQGELALDYDSDFRKVRDIETFFQLQTLKSRIGLEVSLGGTNSYQSELIGLFEKSAGIYDYLLGITDGLEDRSEIAGSAAGMFEDYSIALLDIGKKEKNDSLIYRSLVAKDRAKSQGLLYQLQDHSDLLAANLPPGLLKEQSALREDYTTLKFEMDKLTVGSDQFKLFVDSINIVDNKISDVRKRIEQLSPSLKKINSNSNVIDIFEMQKTLSPKEVIVDVSYLNHKVIVHLLYSQSIEYMELETDDDFLASFKHVLNDIKNPLSRDYKNELLSKISEVFRFLKDDIESIRIIPDRYFSKLPFEMLLVDGDFLVEQYNISYASSLGTLRMQTELSNSDMEYSFSGFAPSYENSIDSVDSELIAMIVRSGSLELQFAKEEVRQIQDIVGGQTYIGEKAKKETFLEAVSEGHVLHMSMHAEMSASSPLNSRLLFGSGENDDEDILLYELYNISTASPMVVLSACETGLGEYHNGDGVRSLASGFLFAGIPSAVMSLWKVPDESTSIIMTSFYSFLKDGLSKDESLRKAKLAYLSQTISEEQRHPFYWSGFLVMGDTSPIKFNSANYFKGWMVVGGVIIFSLLAYVLIKPRVAA